MTYVLIVLFGATFSGGHLTKVGLYKSQASCEMAREILLEKKTLIPSYVICAPIDQEAP